MSDAVTIYDVAAHAQVSISTVSQTINRPNRVNAKTRERVLRAIEELQYVPKGVAVSQARRGVGRVGVLAPFTSYDSFRRRLMGVLAESDGTNRDVVVYDHESAAASVSPLLRTLPVTGRLDGLLIMGLPLDDELAEHLSTRRLPTVLVDSSRPEFSTVNIDDEEGGAMLARHLLQRGHTSFAFLREPQESQAFLSQGQRRDRGFLRVLGGAGIDAAAVPTVLTGNDIVSSRRALGEVLALRPAPTAVFAHHDLLAAGLVLEARRQGLRVPEDLAVAGFDDGSVAEAAGLTTVSQPFEESGRIGARLLAEVIADPSAPVQHITLGLRLVVRDSS
ncbi:LacI family DNA-binding transcriptional regulator [Dactylosporangium sp. CA-233914]|uniref:LacI family DNA-binding transcriptional regulator n=1 Tax=Dactylosporangium sp. CA-233914 TaxID=3239934 RepID=UPI003D9100F1